MTARHDGYWLTPKWIRGFVSQRLGLSCAISRSTARHRSTLDDGRTQIVNRDRYGASLRALKWCCAIYVERRLDCYTIDSGACSLFFALAEKVTSDPVVLAGSEPSGAKR